MAVSKELLDILVCPKCKHDLELEKDGSGLVCHTCSLKFPIVDDIPVMLIDEAIKLNEQST
ncbi:MAG: Trm112 family protein [Deltaproteobacteria bacterium]|nr:Trm112 family protein [Deltaproteobacteria bacterium]MCL5277923.1 Trm112 family protein [Deltaproteobacteria bacterium]